MISSRTRTRMVQFRQSSIIFFKNGTVVTYAAPLAELREDNSVWLYLDNQMNGQRGNTMHHYAVLQDFCPVKTLETRTHHLYLIAPEDEILPISYIENTKHVTTANIKMSVCESVVLSGLLNSVYSSLRVSDHSLRLILAMELRLNDVGEDTIKKIGRWLSATWLTYIHSQISSLSAGIS